MVMRVITNMVLMDWMKRSVSSGTTGSKQPILDSNSTEEMPVGNNNNNKKGNNVRELGRR